MLKGLRYAVFTLLFLVSGCVTETKNPAAAQTRLQLGLIYLAQGELDAAQRNLQRAQLIAPKDYRVQLALARLHQAQKEDDTAQRHYLVALQLAPFNGYVLNNYGAFLCGLGQYDAAQQQFILAGRQPEKGAKADSLENAGYCYLKAGEQGLAREMLVQAIKLDRKKGRSMLAAAEKQFGKETRVETRILLDVYKHHLPASAASVWLEIRFAAQGDDVDDVARHGEYLARNFPQSIQYQHFLANEY